MESEKGLFCIVTIPRPLAISLHTEVSTLHLILHLSYQWPICKTIDSGWRFRNGFNSRIYAYLFIIALALVRAGDNRYDVVPSC